MAQGQVGDGFYIIREGKAQVPFPAAHYSVEAPLSIAK